MISFDQTGEMTEPVCFACCKSSPSLNYMIFDCGCQVCVPCHSKHSNRSTGPICFFCKKPGQATPVSDDLPFRLKKYLIPIKEAAKVYRREIVEVMQFQQVHAEK